MRQIKGDVIMTVRDIEIKLYDRMCYLKTKGGYYNVSRET